MWAVALPSLSAAVTAILVLVILGVAYALVEKSVAIAEPFQTAIRLLIVLLVVLWLLRFFGVI